MSRRHVLARTDRLCAMGVALLIIAVIAFCGLPLMAHAQGTGGSEGAAPMSEQQFIELAGAEQSGDGEGRDASRPMEPATGLNEEKGTESDEEEPGKEDRPGSDEDDEKGETDDDDEEPGAGAGSDDDEAQEPKGEKKREKAATAESDEEPTEVERDTLDAEFQAALEAEGANPSLEDIPEAARPIVAKKLRDLDAGFTRATQRLAEDRKAANAFRAEERFRQTSPERFIVEMLMKNPALSEQVNAIVTAMDEGENTTVIEGHKAIVEKGRRDAAQAEVAETEKQQQHVAKIERYITLGRAAARANNVPFAAGVEEGIAAHIAIHGEISEAEIRAIAKAKARVFKDATRGNRRSRSAEYVKGKTEDRKRAPLKIRPGSGQAPAPAGRAVAKNDQDFINEFAGRL